MNASSAVFSTFRWFWRLTGASQNQIARSVVSAVATPLTAALARAQGITFPTPGVDGFGRLCYLMGWYERETVSTCRRFLRPGANAVDIGAHIGYFSRHFAELVGPSGRVFAFELHRETFQILRRNVARYPNVTAEELAVSDHTGRSQFFEMTASGQHSLVFNVRPETGAFLRSRTTVDSTTLDAYLASQGNPPIALVKMDVDGGESKALRGMVHTITSNPGLKLIVEFAPVSLAAAGGQARRVPEDPSVLRLSSGRHRL